MSVNKDIHRLICTAGKLTDGQARVCDLNWVDGKILGFWVQICPNSGPYKGGRFKFKVSRYMVKGNQPPKTLMKCKVFK